MCTYTLYTGVNYTEGSLHLDTVVAKDIAELTSAITKIVTEEKDAINFVLSIEVNDPSLV